MVIFEQIFRDLLISTNVAADRVFLHRAPQVPAEKQANPFIVFFPVGPESWHSHSGPLAFQDRVYQVSIFDPGQTLALSIGDTIRAALDGLRTTYEGVIFHGVFFQTQAIGWEPDTKLHHVSQDFRIQFRMTADAQPQPRKPANTRINTR
jgi:hypothetical protein